MRGSSSIPAVDQRYGSLNAYLILLLAVLVGLLAIGVQQMLMLLYAIRDYIPPGQGTHTTSFDLGVLLVDGQPKSIWELPMLARGGIFGSLAGSLLLILAAWPIRGSIKNQLGLNGFSWKGLLPWFLFAIVFSLLPNMLGSIIPSLGDEGAKYETMLSAGRNRPLLTVVCVGLAIPFFEELLFRGWLFNKVENVGGPYTALVATSFLFALVHLVSSWPALLIMLGVALALGILRMKSGSIWPGLIMHCANNTAGVLLAFYST